MGNEEMAINKEGKLKLWKWNIALIASAIVFITSGILFFNRSIEPYLGIIVLVISLVIFAGVGTEIFFGLLWYRMEKADLNTLKKTLTNEFKEVELNTECTALKEPLFNFIFGNEIKYFLKIDDDDIITIKAVVKSNEEVICYKTTMAYSYITTQFKI